MKQFDISRFGALLKWHLMSNHRQILNIFFALTIGFFAMMLFFTQVLDFQVLDDGPSTIRLYQMRLEMSMMTGLFCIFICVLVSAARIFRNMKSTSQRITFLRLSLIISRQSENYPQQQATVLLLGKLFFDSYFCHALL